jgi:carbamoylphosphate synthase small subunit
MPSLSAATLRRLSAAHDVDPRSILRELREPGSVRGMAGERARKALSAYQQTKDNTAPAAPTR